MAVEATELTCAVLFHAVCKGFNFLHLCQAMLLILTAIWKQMKLLLIMGWMKFYGIVVCHIASYHIVLHCIVDQEMME